MRRKRLNKQPFGLALVGAALAVLAAVGCNGDGSSGEGSPQPDASPGATPGSGTQPIEAVVTYINANGLDGHRPDPNREAECPFTEVMGTPGVESRLTLGQFCLTSKDFQPEEALTIIAELPDSGESWEMKLEFDAEASLWKVREVDKISR